MEELDPLLPREDGGDGGDTSPPLDTRRERVARRLESSALHKAVIALVVLDSCCVLFDLGYSFLHESCEQDPAEEGPLFLLILEYCSLVINTVFLIEIPLTIYGLGWKYYDPMGRILHSRLHLFDATVILTTFVLEVVLRGRERELAGLLIILRLWRLVKLVGGVAVGAGEISEETERKLADAQEELAKTRARLKRTLEENAQLRTKIPQSSLATR